MQYKQEKSLETEVYRVWLSEHDLVRLARKIAEATSSKHEELNLSVLTGDKINVYTFHDPEFFRSDEMPAEIFSVTMNYSHYDKPINCRLRIYSGIEGVVKLEVSGTSPLVPGLYQDLREMIDQLQVFGHRLFHSLQKFWMGTLTGLILALSLYVLFDLVLSYLKELNEEFVDTSWYTLLIAFSWSLSFMVFLFVVIWLGTWAPRILVPVQFTGRIFDSYSKKRKPIVVVLVSIVLPLALSLLGKLVYDVVRLLVT